jgi:hypothetical protein
VQVAEFDTDNFESRNQSAEDQKLLVKFFIKPREDREKSLEAGRPIMKDVEYIDIKIPGSRNTGICRPASPKDKARFHAHYEAFKGRMEKPSEGTPLIEWPLITRSMCENLAFINIKTVENLAGVADAHINNIMGGLNLKKKAADWLEVAADEAPMLKLKSELAERDERITKMEKQLEQLLAMQATAAPVESSGQDPGPFIEVAPSLTSELDEPVAEEVSTAIIPRRRRKKKVTEDGAIQDNKPDS